MRRGGRTHLSGFPSFHVVTFVDTVSRDVEGVPQEVVVLFHQQTSHLFDHEDVDDGIDEGRRTVTYPQHDLC